MALDLLHDSAEKQEAQVMMARFAKNAHELKDKQDLCKSERHLVGEIVCFEMLVKDNPSVLTNSVSQELLPALETVFKLLAALAKSRNNVEKKYVQDCLKYHGLTVSEK